MYIHLEFATSHDDGLRGAATWPGHPEPARFDGVLELVTLLEAATSSAEENQ